MLKRERAVDLNTLDEEAATVPGLEIRPVASAQEMEAWGEALGYRIGVLQSSDQGYPVYRRLGFVEVCRMEHLFRAP